MNRISIGCLTRAGFFPRQRAVSLTLIYYCLLSVWLHVDTEIGSLSFFTPQSSKINCSNHYCFHLFFFLLQNFNSKLLNLKILIYLTGELFNMNSDCFISSFESLCTKYRDFLNKIIHIYLHYLH